MAVGMRWKSGELETALMLDWNTWRLCPMESSCEVPSRVFVLNYMQYVGLENGREGFCTPSADKVPSHLNRQDEV